METKLTDRQCKLKDYFINKILGKNKEIPGEFEIYLEEDQIRIDKTDVVFPAKKFIEDMKALVISGYFLNPRENFYIFLGKRD